MNKNIILCSDGTGNKNVETNTNVFQIYNSVDLESNDQITYYDNGVGTGSNKYIKGLTGATGLGFKRNITEMYGFLAQHYEPGDKIYLFGFSRGAATVRAMAGMIQTVGLIDCSIDECQTNGFFDDLKFEYQLHLAMKAYQSGGHVAEDFKKAKTLGVVDIEFIGVWDTVSALGFPQDTSWLVRVVSTALDWTSDWIFPHHFFNYQLDKNVQNVYHALAIDDDRKTFHPKVWNEVREDRPKNIEQVWFAGVHSNIGGGYPRSELSNVTLSWMLTKAENCGLRFKADTLSDARAAENVNGILYNARAGLNVYYRFAPRHIYNLTQKDGESILQDKIKIHKSVLNRIKISDYAPTLPNTFKAVDTPIKSKSRVYISSEKAKKFKTDINRIIAARSWLYHILVESTTTIALLGLWMNYFGPGAGKATSYIYAKLLAVVPEFMDNFLYYIYMTEPKYVIALGVFSVLMYGSYKLLRFLKKRTSKKINWLLLNNR